MTEIVKFKPQPHIFTRIFNINFVNLMQLWLEQTSGLWVTPVFFNSEEFASSLEVLSELCPCPSLSSAPLPPKDSKLLTTPTCVTDGLVESRKEEAHSALSEGWEVTTDNQMPMDSWRGPQRNGVPCRRSPLTDTYVTLSTNNQREEKSLNNILEENLPLETLFASRKQICESHSDLGSTQQSSVSSHLSSRSSFEYPNYTWMSKGYIYMAAVDSGVSMDYSPMHRVDDIHINEYRNGIEAHRGAFLVKKHPVYDDG